jgi:hypothetical protein
MWTLLRKNNNNEQAKWSALESVSIICFRGVAGSAAIGGLLVGYEGIIFNVLVTGSVQFFLATLPLLVLFSREGREGAKPAR